MRLSEYCDFPFDLDHVDIEFDIHPATTKVDAQLRFKAKQQSPPAALELNSSSGLRIVALFLDGRPLEREKEYTISTNPQGSGDIVRIGCVPSNDFFMLGAQTELLPLSNTSGEGLYSSNGALVTQCEAQGFRRIIPFPDRPDVLAGKYTCRIEADKAVFPVLLSNGNLMETGDSGGGRHWARWEDPFPKPCYLFAVVAGNLALTEDRFKTKSGRDVALRIWTEWHNASKTAWAMRCLQRAFQWDEERWGLEYDLDLFNIVVIDRFNLVAMENKSLNVFESRVVLATPHTATDDDYLHIM